MRCPERDDGPLKEKGYWLITATNGRDGCRLLMSQPAMSRGMAGVFPERERGGRRLETGCDYLRGWKSYFGWLRSVIWKQWKRGSVRFARLRQQRSRGSDLQAIKNDSRIPLRERLQCVQAIRVPNPNVGLRKCQH